MKIIDKVSQYRAIMDAATHIYLDNLTGNRRSHPMRDAVDMAVELESKVRAALNLEEEI